MYKKLTRKERIELKGYKVIYTTCGKVIAKKEGIAEIGNTLTEVYRSIFGYY